MKLFYFTLLLLLSGSVLKAQQELLVFPSGEEVRENKYIHVRGTPFLHDEWAGGSVTMADSTVYKGLALKYSVYTDQVFYRSPEKGVMMEFLKSVESFIIDKDGGREIYKKGFPAVDKFSEDSYYQVISAGKTQLLFKKSKLLHEEQFYSSATSEKIFKDISAYYVLKNGKMLKVRPSKKVFAKILADKGEAIKAYTNSEEIDYKDKQSLARLFEHYNSL
jgi:hypothetical protein